MILRHNGMRHIYLYNTVRVVGPVAITTIDVLVEATLVCLQDILM